MTQIPKFLALSRWATVVLYVLNLAHYLHAACFSYHTEATD